MLTALRGITWVLVGQPAHRSSPSTPASSRVVNQAVFGLPLFFLLAIGADARSPRSSSPRRGSDGTCRRWAATTGRRRAPASRCAGCGPPRCCSSAFGAGLGGIVYVGQLGSAARRHRLRPRVPGLCGADDRRLLDPARRRRQSDRRRARAAGGGRRRQHPRSEGDQPVLRQHHRRACCCSRRSCSTGCAAATPTNSHCRTKELP